MTTKKTALVVGATGVVGRNLTDELQAQGDWEIVGLSRRGGADGPGMRHIVVNLLDADETRDKLRELTGVTHIFFTGFISAPTWSEMVAPNLALLVNVVDAVEPIAPNLQHISMMQGYKVYGAHLAKFKTPARETDGTHVSSEYNVSQQKFIEERQRGKAWTWSAIRPSMVGGSSVGTPMNLALGLAVYATISKELGVPLRFPGKPGSYDTLKEVTDSSLLAKATVWAATHPRGAGEAFNVANGDLFRWNQMWPVIAKYFDMEVGDPLQLDLTEAMADKGELWDQIAHKHGLKYSYDQVSVWPFIDHVLGYDYDFFADSSKIRRAGFHEYVETEQMFRTLFDEFRSQRVIP